MLFCNLFANLVSLSKLSTKLFDADSCRSGKSLPFSFICLSFAPIWFHLLVDHPKLVLTIKTSRNIWEHQSVQKAEFPLQILCLHFSFSPVSSWSGVQVKLDEALPEILTEELLGRRFPIRDSLRGPFYQKHPYYGFHRLPESIIVQWLCPADNAAPSKLKSVS